MKKIKFEICLLILILSACATPVQSATKIPTTNTIEIQASPTVVILPVPKTISPTVTLPPWPAPSVSVAYQCLKITSDAQQIFGSEDGLIMIAQDKGSSEIYDKLKSPYLYNPANEEKIEIPGAFSFAVSLDNKQMAYVSENDMLVVTDATGKPISQRPFADINIIEWGINGLFVQGADRHPAFLNPFTGERKSLVTNYPNLYPVEDGFDSYWYPEIIYDPSLVMAVFPGLDKQKNETYIALWDTINQKELVNTSRGQSSTILPYMKPEWSVDGNQVIIAAINEEKIQLISIKKDGSVKTLWDVEQGIGTMFYSLSPDQKYIAFWSPAPDNPENTNLSLYVLDITLGKVVNYCIVSPETTAKPIWSPDSKRLAVELKKDMGNSEVVVVDIDKNIAVKIGDDAQPVGWLK